MHAVFLARELGIREVIVPPFPGAFSAWGMLETEIRKDFSRTYYTPLAAARSRRPRADARRAGGRGLRRRSADEGITGETGRVVHAVDIRYVGQEYTLTIPLMTRGRAACRTTSSRRSPQTLPRRPPHPLRPRQPRRAGRVRRRPLDGARRPRPRPSRARMLVRSTRTYPFDDRRGGLRRAGPRHAMVQRDDLPAGHRRSRARPSSSSQTATTVVPPGAALRVDAVRLPGHPRLRGRS